MGQFTITLPDELEDEVRQKVRQGKYGNVSDFVRDAIVFSRTVLEAAYGYVKGFPAKLPKS